MNDDVLAKLLAQKLEEALYETVNDLGRIFILFGHEPEKIYEAFVVLFKTLDPDLKPQFETLKEAGAFFRKLEETAESN